MSLHDDERFEELEARLEAERPRLDAHGLDRVNMRIRARRDRPRKEQPMRTRFAITAMLVLGVMLSTTGVGLAISGTSGSGSAGEAQYPPPPTTPTTPPPPPPETTPTPPPPPPPETTPAPPPPEQDVSPEQEESTPPPSTPDRPNSGSGTLGASDEGTTPPAAAPQETQPAVQATRQLSTEESSGSLPFTGFAVIPMIVAGVALLISGLFLRRRTDGQQ